MKFVDEFRNQKLVKGIASRIGDLVGASRITIMEVCGTHTASVCRFGLAQLLPSSVRLIAGPGCPVCVSAAAFIDQAVSYAYDESCIVVTFGDMMRVPGTRASLQQARAQGANVLVAYSPLDSLTLAAEHPEKKIIFLAVGFETTIATIAASVLLAHKRKLKNLFFLCALKTMPAVMQFLLQDPRLALDGFLCPGHVCAIIGTRPFSTIAQRFGVGCCVAGFEPIDIMEGIYQLVRQYKRGESRVDNQYTRVVRPEGNLVAKKMIRAVFEECDTAWRGLGVVPASGLQLRKRFSMLDANRMIKANSGKLPALRVGKSLHQHRRCRCNEVLKGLLAPSQCPLFAKVCKPDTAVGPCMVSREGACHAYYAFRR